MWIVKIGGSLINSCNLAETVTRLADHGAGNMVIVPGGGIFADQVRYLQKELRIDDTTAHCLALRAMEQFGSMLTSFDPRLHAANSVNAINEWIARNEIPVWFPYDMIAGNPSVKSSWDITSDSLALWLAQVMNCQNLVLLKSTEPENKNYSAGYLSQFGFLDNAFAEMFHDTVVRSWWLFYEQLETFFSLLENNMNTATAGMREITK